MTARLGMGDLADLDALEAAIAKASALPWVADIDDPNTEEPFWTGKFCCGNHHAGGEDGTWETWGEAKPCDVPNARLIELITANLPAMIAELRTWRALAKNVSK